VKIRVLAGGARHIDFQTDPSRYGTGSLMSKAMSPTLTMDVDENGGCSKVISSS